MCVACGDRKIVLERRAKRSLHNTNKWRFPCLGKRSNLGIHLLPTPQISTTGKTNLQERKLKNDAFIRQTCINAPPCSRSKGRSNKLGCRSDRAQWHVDVTFGKGQSGQDPVCM